MLSAMDVFLIKRRVKGVVIQLKVDDPENPTCPPVPMSISRSREFLPLKLDECKHFGRLSISWMAQTSITVNSCTVITMHRKALVLCELHRQIDGNIAGAQDERKVSLPPSIVPLHPASAL